MGDKRNWKNPDDTPQFNYRQPGEPETYGMESKEDPDKRRKAVKKSIDAGEERAAKAREADVNETGVSSYKGTSPPMTQKQTDDENTWSPGR